MQSAIQAGISFGAKAVNCSFTHMNDNSTVQIFDNFMDRMLKNNRTTIVVAAGNDAVACGGSGNVGTPGKAYGAITVGGFDDKNSVSWSDDSFFACQSTLGPSSLWNDRNKPEVIAPAVNIRSTTTSSPWIDIFALGGNTGTSFAAPHVTGEVALIMSREFSIRFRPEAVKAVVLASSAHQILNSGGTYPREEEGAGLISASWADDILTGTMGNWGEVSYVCASPNPFLVATMPNLSSGLRTRVAIAWGQPHGYANYYTQPSADLNLVVKDPFGTIVSGFGNSHDETCEYIEFVTSIPGNYTINIQRRYCDAVSNSVVGYAWWQFH